MLSRRQLVGAGAAVAVAFGVGFVVGQDDGTATGGPGERVELEQVPLDEVGRLPDLAAASALPALRPKPRPRPEPALSLIHI